MNRDLRAVLLVLAASGAATGALFVQVLHPFPFLNDAVLHFGLVESLASASARHQSLLDPWVPQWALGFPVFHYYQILPHLLVLAIAKASFGALSPIVAFRGVEALSAGLLPIPVYFAARHFGFSRVAAASAAVLALAPRTNYLQGMELESSTWQGLGQFTQAVGMLAFPLSLARSWSAIAGRSSMGVAAALVSITTVSHVALGVMALLAAPLFALVAPRDFPRRIARVALIALLASAGAAFVLVPVAQDFAYYNVSALVPSWKYDSFGHETILTWFATGALFDFGRLPVLTTLIALGLVALARRAPKDEPVRAVLALFVAFLLLYFGRPTWGRLLQLLPLGDGFHFSRALAPFQLASVLAAGFGAGGILEWLARSTRLGRAGFWIAIVVAACVAAPLAIDRGEYLARNAKLVRESAAGYERERVDLEEALRTAQGDRLGRVYAGLGAAGGRAWGGAFMVGWVPVYSFLPLREIDAFGYLHHHYSLNADLFDRFDERNPIHYRAFAIRRVIAPADLETPPFLREIARFGRFRVLEVDAANQAEERGFFELGDAPYSVHVKKRELGRVQARWLASALPGRGVHPRVRLAEIEAPETSGMRVDGNDVRFPDPSEVASPGSILEVRRVGEDFEVRAAAARESVLVFKMTYHPLWKAWVDGRPAETMHVLPSYIGIPLASGNHRVELRYVAGSTKPTLLAAGAFAIAAGLFFSRKRRSA